MTTFVDKRVCFKRTADSHDSHLLQIINVSNNLWLIPFCMRINMLLKNNKLYCKYN